MVACVSSLDYSHLSTREREDRMENRPVMASPPSLAAVPPKARSPDASARALHHSIEMVLDLSVVVQLVQYQATQKQKTHRAHIA